MSERLPSQEQVSSGGTFSLGVSSGVGHFIPKMEAHSIEADFGHFAMHQIKWRSRALGQYSPGPRPSFTLPLHSQNGMASPSS